MLNPNFPRILFTAGLALALGYVAPAFAQSDDDDDDDEFVIEEIVVTVERREQSLQDVAGTAASFSGEELKLLGAKNINDLDGSLPGLSIANNAGNIEVYIRGIGSSNNTELGDPAAATHLDGTYIPRPAGFGAAFFDIERVEVNVGPQGTLRGRNATAGSINVIPFKPGIGIFNAMAEYSVGDYDESRLEGMVNIPISSNSALRIAGFTMEHDSYYTIENPANAADNGIPTAESEGIEGGEAADDAGLRLSYLQENFAGVEDLRLTATYDAIEQKGTGYTGTNYASALAHGVDPDSVDPRRVYVRPITPEEDTEHSGARIQLDWATSAFSVEYALSSRDLVYNYDWGGAADTPVFDGALEASLVDGTAQQDFDFDNFNRVGLTTDSQSVINELRFFSDSIGTVPVRWTLGLFVFEEEQKTFLGGVGDNNTFFYGNEFNQRTDTDSSSLYADATWSLRDDTVRITAGLRSTSDDKKRTGINIRYNRFALAGGNNFGNVFAGPRAGTEGFEFAGLDRRHLIPDTNGDNRLSPDEVTDFYLDGVASFGERDTMDEWARLVRGIFAYTEALGAPGGIGGGTDGAVAGGAFNAPTDGRPTCDQLIAVLPNAEGQCPVTADLIFNIAALENRVPYLVPISSVFATQNGSLENDFTDWRFRGEYDLTEDNLLYGLLATGHKSGGFNDNLPNVTATRVDGAGANTPPVITVTFNGDGPVPTYREESVRLLEIGSKNVFEVGEMRYTVNGSYFNYDYQDLQITNLVSNAQILDFSGIGGSGEGALTDRRAIDSAGATDNILAFTFNAADAEISGLSIDGDVQFPSNLKIGYNLLLLNEATIKDSVLVQDSRFSPEVQQAECFPRGAPGTPDDGQLLEPTDACNAREQSVEGNRLPRTPEVQLTTSVSKAFRTSSGYIDVIASLGYRSEQHMTIFNGRVYNDELSDLEKQRIADVVGSYSTLDFGFGYTFENEGLNFRAEAYINNVTDEQQAQAIIITQRDNTRFFSRPRTAGVRFRVIF